MGKYTMLLKHTSESHIKTFWGLEGCQMFQTHMMLFLFSKPTPGFLGNP